MDELQFIIPDLDLTPVQHYLQTHVKHALDDLSDPDIPISSDLANFEIRRLSAASEALEDLRAIYDEWQWKRKIVRESVISLLEKLEEFDKEPESAE